MEEINASELESESDTLALKSCYKFLKHVNIMKSKAFKEKHQNRILKPIRDEDNVNYHKEAEHKMAVRIFKSVRKGMTKGLD